MKKIIPFILLVLAVTACKKNKTTDEEVPLAKTEFLSTLDGKTYKLDQSAIKATYYSDAADPKKQIEVAVNLDVSGNKLVFFIDEIKDGTINLSPKTGLSGVETSVSYILSAVYNYALSGKLITKIDADKKVLKISWDIAFKVSDNDITSKGDFTILNYDEKPVAKTEIKGHAPLAGNDGYETDFEKELSGNVAQNDSDPDKGEVLTYSVKTQPANGTLVLNANGTFTYNPKKGFSGNDSFEYIVTDPTSLTAKGVANIIVKPAPVVNDTKVTFKKNGVEITQLHSSTKLIYAQHPTNPKAFWFSVNITWGGGASFIVSTVNNTIAGSKVFTEGEYFDFNDSLTKGQFPVWGVSTLVFTDFGYKSPKVGNVNYMKLLSVDKGKKYAKAEGKLEYGNDVYEYVMEGTYEERPY